MNLRNALLAIHAAAETAGLKPRRKLIETLTRSLAKFVRKYEERAQFSLKVDQLLKQVFAIALTAGIGITAGPPTAILVGGLAIAANATLKATRIELNVRDELVRTLELPANRTEVIDALNAIIDHVQERAQQPLLMIIDGLDKVPTSHAQLLFADSPLLTEPACALLYAAPIEFYHRLTAGQVTNLFDEYRILPNPPVHKRPPTGEHWNVAREENPPGLAVMSKVVASRFEAQGKRLHDLITPAALDLLMRMSGGVMRELIRYIRDAVTFAQLLGVMEIDEAIAQEVMQQQRQEMAPRLKINHRDALRHVLQQGVLSGGQQEALEDELLRSLHLLSYDDPTHWFDVHPNVLPLL